MESDNASHIVKSDNAYHIMESDDADHVMESDGAYGYKPLADLDSMIWLIRILSITPDIRCEVDIVSFETQLVFSALSYKWGDLSI